MDYKTALPRLEHLRELVERYLPVLHESGEERKRLHQEICEVSGEVSEISCGVHGSIDSRQGAGTMGLNQLSTAAGGSNWISNGCGFVAGIGTTVLAGMTTVSALAFITAEVVRCS